MILIDDRPISKLSQASLRHQIGVVLQEAFLFSNTVMNNLKYARPGATDEECITAAKEANAHEFILNLPQGYNTVMTERGANLSQEGLRKLMAGRTSFVITHQLSIIRRAAKIMVANGGEVIEMDTHDNLMAKKGFYYSLYMSQFRGQEPARAGANFVST